MPEKPGLQGRITAGSAAGPDASVLPAAAAMDEGGTKTRNERGLRVKICVVRMLAALGALTASGLVLAEDPAAGTAPASAATDTFPAEERAQLRQHAAELRQQAHELQLKADETRAAAEHECWKRTLVSACMEDADEEKRQTMKQARKLEIEAGDIERNVRKRVAEARRAEKVRSAEERRLKGIEISVKTRERDEQRERDAAARVEKDADMAAKAQKQQQDAAQHERDAADKRRREEARAAERAAKQREHAAKIDERLRKKQEEQARRDADAAARAAKTPAAP